MRTHLLYVLPLAASLAIPALAQQSPDNQQATTTMTSSSQEQPAAAQNSADMQVNNSAANEEQDLSARQPLQPEMHEGFWGKLNPFARKKYVQRQMTPIRNRVNELDELTAANAKSIQDVDARAQQGVREASARASEADRHATEAGNTAQQANQTALAASNRLSQVEQVVGNIDQYQPTSQTEIRFQSGQTTLGPKAKAALDDMASNLSEQKGYVIEVQGFAGSRGQAGIQSSQVMANSVVRYLVEHHNIPVYRIYVLGMGNAKIQSYAATSSSNPKTSRPAPNRVEVSLLKNNLEQLASSAGPAQQAAGQSISQNEHQ